MVKPVSFAATESKTEKELIKVVRETAAKRDANLERMAQGSGKAAAQAKVMIDNDKKLLEMQGRLTGRIPENVKDMQVQSKAIEDQKEIMEAQKKELEALGLKAEDQASYRKEEIKLAKLELKQAKSSGSKEAEIEAKKKLADLKQTTFLGKISGSLTGILEGTKDKIKGGLSGFKKFAFGALAVAALAFLNNPKFEELKKTIVETIIPILAYLYDNVIKPLATIAFEKLKQLLISIKGFVDGDKGILTVLGENKLIFSLIAVKLFGLTAILKAFSITAGLVGKALMLFNATYRKQVLFNLRNHIALLKGKAFAVFKTVTGILTGIAVKMKAIFLVGFGKVAAAFTALKVAFAPMLLPFTIIIGIVTVVVGLVYGIMQAVKDFKRVFDETGSIVEALKSSITTFIQATLGNLVNAVSGALGYVLTKIGNIFGFEELGKIFTDFDFKKKIKEGMDTVFEFIENIFTFDYAGFVKGLLPDNKFGRFVGGLLGGGETKEAKKSNTENAAVNLKKSDVTAAVREELPRSTGQTAGGRGDSRNYGGRGGRGFVPAQREATPPPAIVNAPTTVNSPSTTNVSQNATSLAPTDRVLDQLSVAI